MMCFCIKIRRIKTMKKITSFFLAMLLVVSVAISVGAAVTVTPKTYVANVDYMNSNGLVSEYKFYYNSNKNGERICFDPNMYKNKYDEYDEIYPSKSYVKGNLIYYRFEGISGNNKTYSLCSSDITVTGGKKKKILYTAEPEVELIVIGGYGDSIIFSEGRSIKKYSKGKVTTLVKTVKNKELGAPNVDIFNGKLYYYGTTYDLKSGKTGKFDVKKVYSTEKYLYYYNKNNNLKRLHMDGKTEMVAQGVDKVLYTSSLNGGEAVYTLKKDSKSNTAYYYKCANDKAVKLFDNKRILKYFKENYLSYRVNDEKAIKNCYVSGLFNEVSRDIENQKLLRFMFTIPNKKGSDYGYLEDIYVTTDEDLFGFWSSTYHTASFGDEDESN